MRKKVLKTQKQSTSKGKTDQNKVEKRVNYAQDSEANEKIRKAIAALESKKTQLLLPNGKPKSIRMSANILEFPNQLLVTERLTDTQLRILLNLEENPCFQIKILKKL